MLKCYNYTACESVSGLYHLCVSMRVLFLCVLPSEYVFYVYVSAQTGPIDLLRAAVVVMVTEEEKRKDFGSAISRDRGTHRLEDTLGHTVQYTVHV